MAAQTVRTKQRATAVQRLIDSSNAVADKIGVEPADIPTRHRDPAYLPTLQIEAVAGLLERIAGIDAPEPDAETETVPEPDAPADKPAKRTSKAGA
jgi:hypothetical protein